MTTTQSETWATGSCLCGSVRYSLVGKPDFLGRYVCHCVLCKKASGSAFMANWWMSKNVVSITAGEESVAKVVITATKSGYTVKRSFCKSCGSPLFLTSENPQMAGEMGITAGTLDFDKELPVDENVALNWTPDGEVFVGNRLSCLVAIAGVKQVLAQ